MTKKERKLNKVRAYVKDKMRLFKAGKSERSKAIIEVLTNIKYILDS